MPHGPEEDSEDDFGGFADEEEDSDLLAQLQDDPEAVPDLKDYPEKKQDEPDEPLTEVLNKIYQQQEADGQDPTFAEIILNTWKSVFNAPPRLFRSIDSGVMLHTQLQTYKRRLERWSRLDKSDPGEASEFRDLEKKFMNEDLLQSLENAEIKIQEAAIDEADAKQARKEARKEARDEDYVPEEEEPSPSPVPRLGRRRRRSSKLRQEEKAAPAPAQPQAQAQAFKPGSQENRTAVTAALGVGNNVTPFARDLNLFFYTEATAKALKGNDSAAQDAMLERLYEVWYKQFPDGVVSVADWVDKAHDQFPHQAQYLGEQGLFRKSAAKLHRKKASESQHLYKGQERGKALKKLMKLSQNRSKYAAFLRKKQGIPAQPAAAPAQPARKPGAFDLAQMMRDPRRWIKKRDQDFGPVGHILTSKYEALEVAKRNSGQSHFQIVQAISDDLGLDDREMGIILLEAMSGLRRDQLEKNFKEDAKDWAHELKVMFQGERILPFLLEAVLPEMPIGGEPTREEEREMDFWPQFLQIFYQQSKRRGAKRRGVQREEKEEGDRKEDPGPEAAGPDEMSKYARLSEERDILIQQLQREDAPNELQHRLKTVQNALKRTLEEEGAAIAAEIRERTQIFKAYLQEEKPTGDRLKYEKQQQEEITHPLLQRQQEIADELKQIRTTEALAKKFLRGGKPPDVQRGGTFPRGSFGSPPRKKGPFPPGVLSPIRMHPVSPQTQSRLRSQRRRNQDLLKRERELNDFERRYNNQLRIAEDAYRRTRSKEDAENVIKIREALVDITGQLAELRPQRKKREWVPQDQVPTPPIQAPEPPRRPDRPVPLQGDVGHIGRARQQFMRPPSPETPFADLYTPLREFHNVESHNRSHHRLQHMEWLCIDNKKRC